MIVANLVGEVLGLYWMQKQVARPGKSVAAMAGLTLPVQVTVGDFGTQLALEE